MHFCLASNYNDYT